MRCVFVVLIYLPLTRSVSSNINYCGASMCGKSDTHTFCQYSDSPAEQCVGFVPAPLSSREKINIVSRMNQRRNDAAMGMLSHLPSAADMVTVRWIDELAREAQLWANQCSPPEFPGQHDLCRDLYSIPVGQNVASVVGEAPGLRVETMVDLWYMQGRHYKGDIKSYIPPPYNLSYYGDFAQMLWSPTFMVGCARTKFLSLWKGRGHSVTRLVCNMAPRGPRTARPLWTPGPPASLCPPRTRPSIEHAGLCTPYIVQIFDDKKNKTSLQHSVLLSTLAEMENNSAVDYVGRLDELYLTKLAALTMEQSNKVSQVNRLKTLEAITSKLGVKLGDHNNIIIKRIARERRKIRRYLGKPKRKLRLIGRPKAYYLYELIKEEDKAITKNSDYVKTTMTISKVNENIQIVKHDDKTGIKNISSIILHRSLKGKESREKSLKEVIITDVTPLDTETISTKITNLTSADINADVKDLERHSPTLSNDITYEEDDSDISDEVIQDYLSNPETARQIQETLLRAEQSMASMVSVNISGDSTDTSTLTNPVSSTRTKVRRDLRTTDSEDFEQFRRQLQKSVGVPKDDDDDANPFKKAVEKGTMMQSLFKYLPGLKSLGIAPGPGSSATCTVIPSFSFIFLLLYTVL